MPENFEITIKNFHINSPGNNSFSDVLISSPSPVQKRTLGKLLLITQINSKVQTKNLANIINENIRSNYYSNINANIEFALESTLMDFNKKVKEIEKLEKIKDLKDKLSCAVIVIKENSIYFTQHGGMKSLLFHKDQIVDIGGEKLKDSESKVFSDIVIGKITKNNVILFSTSTFFDYIEKEKVVNHLQNSNIENTTEFLRKSLDAQENIESSVAFILVGENKPVEDEILFTEEAMVVEEDGIIQEIAPKMNASINMFSNITNKLVSGVKDILKNKKLNDFIKHTQANSKQVISKITESGKTGVKGSGKKVQELIKNLSETSKKNAEKIREEIKKEPLDIKLKNFFINCKKWFIELALSKKIAFLSMFGLIFIGFLGFRIWQNNQKVKLEEQRYQESVEIVKSVHNEASSSLIYNNVPKAKELIANAEYLISKLNINSKSRKEIQASLIEENKTILNKVYKINTITNPNIVFDFKTLAPLSASEQITGDKILNIGEKYFVFDYKNKTIYNLPSSKDQSLEKINIESNISEIKMCGVSEVVDKNILCLDSKNKLFVFNGTTLEEIEMKDKLNDYNISEMNSYGSTLYFTDKTKNQIYTLKKTNNKYGNVYSWLKTPSDLQKNTSMAIDGYIYLANSTGSVDKFLRGYSRVFTLDEINPKLENITKIHTDENTDNLYILDSVGKRLVVFNKNTNALVAQYISEDFKNLKDFWIDFSKNKAYLIDDNRIVDLSLN